MSEKTPATKKKRLARIRTFARNLKDAYTISKRTYPWVGWAMLGCVSGLPSPSRSYFYGQRPAGMVLDFDGPFGYRRHRPNDFVVDRQARLLQPDRGMPGAAKAVLDQLPRGWTLEENPVFINQKTATWCGAWLGAPA